MRVPVLSLLAALLLSSCSNVLNQQIVRAQVSAPSAPPLPILPVDEPERFVVQAGIAQRLGTPPAGRPLSDTAGSNLQLDFDPQTFGGLFVLHYKAFWSGIELASDRTSVLLGVNVQNEDWKCLGYFGLGSTSFHQNLLLRQQVDYFDVHDTLVPLVGTASNTTTSLGISAQFTNQKVQPFLAIRVLGGPTVEGSSGDQPNADNAFSLSQVLVYAGVRGDLAPRLHVLAGAGWRTFTGGLIQGSDWNAYLGASFDLGLAEHRTLDLHSLPPPEPAKTRPAPRDTTPEIESEAHVPASVTPVGP